MPVLLKAWNGLANDCLHENGFLGFVQSTGKEPKEGQPLSYDKQPDFEDFGVGCFLLAGTEVYKLKWKVSLCIRSTYPNKTKTYKMSMV